MALGTTQKADVTKDHRQHVSYPSDYGCRWQTVCTAPDVAESGDAVAGGEVVRPGSIDRAEQRRFQPGGMGNRLLIALRYNSDVGTPTSPIVRVFGSDGPVNPTWHTLRNDAGDIQHELTVNPTTDAVSEDGTTKVTDPVEVYLDGSFEVIVAVDTAFAAGTGTGTGAEIIVKTAGAK